MSELRRTNIEFNLINRKNKVKSMDKLLEAIWDFRNKVAVLGFDVDMTVNEYSQDSDLF